MGKFWNIVYVCSSNFYKKTLVGKCRLNPGPIRSYVVWSELRGLNEERTKKIEILENNLVQALIFLIQ